jgi:hypothetical protein
MPEVFLSVVPADRSFLLRLSLIIKVESIAIIEHALPGVELTKFP